MKRDSTPVKGEVATAKADAIAEPASARDALLARINENMADLLKFTDLSDAKVRPPFYTYTVYTARS